MRQFDHGYSLVLLIPHWSINQRVSQQALGKGEGDRSDSEAVTMPTPSSTLDKVGGGEGFETISREEKGGLAWPTRVWAPTQAETVLKYAHSAQATTHQFGKEECLCQPVG
jgi:hypothetical protein